MLIRRLTCAEWRIRQCLTKMGFGSDLKNSHEAVLKLQDWELRLLETVKKFMALRIKSDKEYASTLQNLCNQVDKESTLQMNYVSNVSKVRRVISSFIVYSTIIVFQTNRSCYWIRIAKLAFSGSGSKILLIIRISGGQFQKLKFGPYLLILWVTRSEMFELWNPPSPPSTAQKISILFSWLVRFENYSNKFCFLYYPIPLGPLSPAVFFCYTNFHCNPPLNPSVNH